MCRFRTAAALVALGGVVLFAQNDRVTGIPDLQRMSARFAPTDIGADVSKLSAPDRRVLAKLVEASKIIDALFLDQVWSGNEAIALSVCESDGLTRSPLCANLPGQQ